MTRKRKRRKPEQIVKLLQEGQMMLVTGRGSIARCSLSPILSNVVLDELDWELELRGMWFVRHADDFSIFVRSHRVRERVMASVQRFIERKLRLVINESKSSVSKPFHLNFLRFHFGKGRDSSVSIGISQRTKKWIDARMRELTPSTWGGFRDVRWPDQPLSQRLDWILPDLHQSEFVFAIRRSHPPSVAGVTGSVTETTSPSFPLPVTSGSPK